MAEVGVVVLGAGYFARHHLTAWRELDGARLLGVVDRDPARAEAAASEFGTRAVPDLSTALAAGPDLVDVVLPPEAHLGAIRATLGAGVPTICQKPFCGGSEGAREAAALARRAGVPLVVHENFRWQPWWRRIREEVRAGAVGPPYQATFRLRPGDGQGPDAYLERQSYFRTMPRFLVHETAVHLIDVARFLMGRPDWVWADLRRLNPVIAGEDAGLVVLGFGDGRRAVIDANRLADHVAEDRRRVMGEALVEGPRGTLALDGDGGLTLRAHGSNDARALPLAFRADRFGGGCVGALQAHVLDHLGHGAALENTAEDYLECLEIVEAVYEAGRSGSRVPLAAAT